MHRRLLLTGTVALLVGLSLRSSPAQSGPAAPVILSVSGVSQNAAQPTAAVAGSTVTGTVLVHNDYTWTPESDPFQSLVGSGGVPIDPSDPGQRGADVPGGTNVLGLPADRLYVSIDGFVTPLAASAENPAFRTGGGCTPPAGLEEVAGAGPAYAHSISVALACYAIDPSACGPDSGLYVRTSGDALTFEWHLVLDSTSICRSFQLTLDGAKVRLSYDPGTWSDGRAPVAGIVGETPAVREEPLPGMDSLPPDFVLGRDSAEAQSGTATVDIGVSPGTITGPDLPGGTFGPLTSTTWPGYDFTVSTGALQPGPYTLRFTFAGACPVEGPVCRGAYVALTPPCASDADCDDGNACTVDHCGDGGACQHTPAPAGSPCDDGNACTTGDTCDDAGGCLAGAPLSCDDGDACTVDSCDPASGCRHTPVSVDDGRACTADACDPVTGKISHTPINRDGDPASLCDADCDDTDPTVYPGAPRVCDGKDHDCDGVADYTQTGCDCLNGSTRSCGTDVGACEFGTETCVSGAWGACVGGVGPHTEVCNGLDDDCDGQVDEGLGTTTCGVGACTRTVQNCVGGVSQTCTPGTPAAEICNGIDDDCDGQVDEELGTTTCGVGACVRTVPTCVGGMLQTCTPGTPTAETCNGIDDDCDGQVDEGLGTTSCGVGACARTVPTCVGGMLQVCSPGTPTAETCNGIDDDCDGQVDEGLGTTSCGVGACARTVPTCVGGMLQVCSPGTPTAETCNGIDDDCDGQVDEGLGTTSCGVGACARTVPTCVGGMLQVCSPGTPTAETCNGIDDDCDGTIDEDFDADRDGFTTCGGDCNDTVATIHPGAPEFCNGLDDNCNTAVDEGFLDTDADGLADCVDPDDDNDLVPDGSDCAPLVNSVSAVPGEVGPTLHVVAGAPRGTFTWTPIVQANVDDVYRSTWNHVTGSLSAGLTCLVAETTATRFTDSSNPPIGSAYYYVITGTNTCGEGTAGTGTNGQPLLIPSHCVPQNLDTDGDGVHDIDDGCPLQATAFQADRDHDGRGDVCDNCADLPNPGQEDADGNGIGDACQDLDHDGYPASQDCDDHDPAIHPGATETCNGRDDNCDGRVDEGFGTTTCGVGACTRTVNNCSGGVPQTCTPGTPTAEICNGLDDDCDGSVDEGLGTTTCGVGACTRTVNNCSGGVPRTCTPGTPTAEICNGVDDDCDGSVDEGLGTTTCGVGACTRTVDNCVNGSTQTCTPGAPIAETCNSVDDDCNGSVDDGLGSTTCGVGACARTVINCVGGQVQSCIPGGPTTEICNGADDNCNGFVDEGFLDTDGDGLADCVDPDDDNDGRADASDNCPLVFNPNQADLDGDGRGDACDSDADGDGFNSFATGSPIQVVALSEQRSQGTQTGTLASMQTSDNMYEAIKEIKTGNVSLLEMEWFFNVATGHLAVVYVEAFQSASADGDNFQFSYSTDGSNFTDMFVVSKTVDDDLAQYYTLPPFVRGTVIIRARDTNRTSGNTLDTLSVDQIRVLSSDPADCNDLNASINPAANEGPPGAPTCSDLVDNNCDGRVDGGDANCR